MASDGVQFGECWLKLSSPLLAPPNDSTFRDNRLDFRESLKIGADRTEASSEGKNFG